MKDRSVRSLIHLQGTASTARVLNLHRVWRMAARQAAAGVEAPEDVGPSLFNAPELDRSIIIKHRLRRDEVDLFDRPRSLATKVVLPIDVRDLKLGGRAFFVDQRGFHDLMRATFGDAFAASRDLELLQALDHTPSLDPFLLRERFKAMGLNPARRYFEISAADTRRMTAFVEAHLAPLVRISFDDANAAAQVSRLGAKILSGDLGQDLEPLRQTLRMDPVQYLEGMFCWKGFLYYKWRLGALMADVEPVARQIQSIRPYGEQDGESRAYLSRSRATLGRAVLGACAAASRTLRVYDDAFRALVEEGKPQAFRDFLLNAPGLFVELGERLGTVSHIVSFWSFRFPPGQTWAVSVEELMDIFMEFETGLNVEDPTGPDAARRPDAGAAPRL